MTHQDHNTRLQDNTLPGKGVYYTQQDSTGVQDLSNMITTVVRNTAQQYVTLAFQHRLALMVYYKHPLWLRRCSIDSRNK